MYGKFSDEEVFIRSLPTTLLEIFRKIILESQDFVESIKYGDNNFSSINMLNVFRILVLNNVGYTNSTCHQTIRFDHLLLIVLSFVIRIFI